MKKIFDGATSCDSFLKPSYASEPKVFTLGMGLSAQRNTKHRTSLSGGFQCGLRICNPLKAKYKGFVDLLKIGLTTKQAVVETKLSKPTTFGVEIYQISEKNGSWNIYTTSTFFAFTTMKMLFPL